MDWQEFKGQCTGEQIVSIQEKLYTSFHLIIILHTGVFVKIWGTFGAGNLCLFNLQKMRYLKEMQAAEYRLLSNMILWHHFCFKQFQLFIPFTSFIYRNRWLRSSQIRSL
ncbi:uncharacterized protein LOC135147665 isoform X1 [Daucus carota subsp. sativus]|uniref:uncharacterized protein LOC135147665 isoform X1 n=1 Tax=Daucus carota subsp. sativus TaxID=79200 RepID=UPI003082940C